MTTIPYYTIWYNGKSYENISAKRVLEFPSEKMICIFKFYYKGTYDRKITNLCLFSIDSPIEADDLIKDIKNWSKEWSSIYGSYLLTSEDEEIIRKFNL